VVAAGDTTIELETVPPGFQVYERAPLAESVELPAGHIAVGDATAVIVGPLLTGAKTVA
jgi:hypothetical protein